MSPLTCQASSRFIPLRFVLWLRPTTRRTRLLRGHQSPLTPHAGGSVFLIFTPSSPSLMGLLRVSVPTQTKRTSTFFLLIPLLPAAVLPQVSTSASSRHCVRLVPREFGLMLVL